MAGDEIDHYVNLLAYHYERSDNLAKKRAYLRRAGEAAARRSANDAAVDYLSRALDLAPADDLTERWALLWERVHVFHMVGTRAAEVRDLDALDALAEAFDDDVRRAEAGVRRSWYAEAIAAYADGAAIAERALKLAQAAGATATVAAAGLALGSALQRHGHFEQAELQLAQTFELAEQASLVEVAAECLSGRGVNALARGDYQRAHDLEIQAYERYRAIRHRRGQGTAFGNLGEHARMYGDYASARTYYEQAIHILDEIGDRRYACLGYGNVGLAANMQGAYAEARASVEQGLRLAREAGEQFGEGALMGVLGDALLGLGQPIEAAAADQSAVDSLRALGLPHSATEPLAGLARVALAEGNHAKALAHVEEILAHLQSGGTLDGTNEPLRVYLTCYRVLQTVRDSGAAGVLETAYATLQEQAAKIPDASIRHSVLENVPYHREIVAAWADLIGKAA